MGFKSNGNYMQTAATEYSRETETEWLSPPAEVSLLKQE